MLPVQILCDNQDNQPRWTCYNCGKGNQQQFPTCNACNSEKPFWKLVYDRKLLAPITTEIWIFDVATEVFVVVLTIIAVYMIRDETSNEFAWANGIVSVINLAINIYLVVITPLDD